jgi:hypothetical protein
MNKSLKIPWPYLVAIFLSGFCIGFLVGLSASPVVNALIGGIVSLAAGVVSALCGVRLEKSEPKDSPAGEEQNEGIGSPGSVSAFSAQVSPVPIAFLIVSIVLGSLLGLQARTHEWFAESPEHLADKWQKSTGLSKEQIAVRLFNSIYGAGKEEAKSEKDKDSEAKPISAGVLFAVAAQECKRLRSLDAKDLRLEIQALGPNIKQFAIQCKSDEDLKLALDLLICPDKDQH